MPQNMRLYASRRPSRLTKCEVVFSTSYNFELILGITAESGQDTKAGILLRKTENNLEEIGAGGMGVVFRAHDERLDRDVAVKVLPPGSLSDEAARKRFRNEAHALSRLNHSNIAAIYDFDSQDGGELPGGLRRGSHKYSRSARKNPLQD